MLSVDACTAPKKQKKSRIGKKDEKKKVQWAACHLVSRPGLKKMKIKNGCKVASSQAIHCQRRNYLIDLYVQSTISEYVHVSYRGDGFYFTHMAHDRPVTKRKDDSHETCKLLKPRLWGYEAI